MCRISFALALTACALVASSAQFWRERVQYPETDPTAFRISTQADLEDALSRIARIRASMAETSDAEERRAFLTTILEICQRELNRDANASGVVVVERASKGAKVPDLPLRWQGAYSAIEDQVRELGDEALKLYEEIYGPRVLSLLNEAARSRDTARMANLNRRFGLTRAGALAAVTLASLYWEEGGVSEAARMLERALENRAGITGAERAHLYAWLGHCYRMHGQRANLRRIIDESTPLHETTAQAGDSAAKLIDVLSNHLQQTRDAADETIDRLGVHWIGANYANTGAHEVPFAYGNAAWAQTLPAPAASRHPERFMGYVAPIVPPYLPVFDGSVIYVNSGEHLAAYDLINGSRGPIWTCKPFPTLSQNWRTSEPDPSHILPVSVYRGTVFAAIENPLSTNYHRPTPEPNFRLYSHYPKVRRALCAVDAASGRVMWKVGGEYEGDSLATVNFLSAVAYEDVLYAIATRSESQAEVFLYALDPASGDVIWDLRLCYGQQETTMFGRPAREPHASLPAISGSLLYVCTNIGGVAAVDLNTRGIRWVSRYDYMPRPVSKYTETFYREVTWYNSPTIYAEHEGRAYVVVAPTDANMLFALDAATGRQLWQVNREGEPLNGGRALVGVRNGQVIVAGDGGMMGSQASVLSGIELATGRHLRSARAAVGDRGQSLALSGRPAMASNRVLWPGTDSRVGSHIAEIDLSTFRVVRTASVPNSYGAAGYSVFAQNGIVFTTAGRDYTLGNAQMAVRFDAAELLNNARAELQANPEDADANLRLGLLTLRLGDREEGLRIVRKAHALASQPPANARARDQAGHALVDEFLTQAQAALRTRSFEEAGRLARQAAGFASTRGQRSECFLLQEQALRGQDSRAAIEDFYRDTMAANPDFGVGSDPELPARYYATIRLAESRAEAAPAEAVAFYHTLLTANRRLMHEGATLRTHAINRLRGLLREHGREAFRESEASANALLEQNQPAALRNVLERYPLSEASDTAVFRLAETELHEFRPEEGAELIRAALDEFPDRPRLNDLNALMAVCYGRAGHALRARLMAARLLREAPDGKLTLHGSEQTYAELLGPLAKAGDGAEVEQRLPRLPSSIKQLWRRSWSDGFERLPTHHTDSEGKIYMSRAGTSGSGMFALDAATGDVAWNASANVMVTETHRTARGTLLALHQGFSLVDDGGNELWSVTTPGAPNPISLQAGMLVYATRYHDARTRQSYVRIDAIDAATGGNVWEARIEGNTAMWLSHSSHGILAMLQNGAENQLLLLDPEDGSTRAQTTLPGPGRPNAMPALVGDRVFVANRDGRLQAYRADNLQPGEAWDTRVRIPTLIEPYDDDLIVIGALSAARFSTEAGQQVWRVDMQPGEAVMGRHRLRETLTMVTRGSNGTRIRGYHLKDGKEAFTHELQRGNEQDRLDLQREAVFDDGLVAVFTDLRVRNSRLTFWGFRLLVLNADGTERFRWEYEADGGPTTVQLGVIDNYIALAAGNTTFGFGSR